MTDIGPNFEDEELDAFDRQDIKDYMEFQRIKIQAQEAELAGEIQAGTPERSLTTLRDEIERRYEIIAEGEALLASSVSSTPDLPVTPVPTDGPIIPTPLDSSPTEVITAAPTPTPTTTTTPIATTATETPTTSTTTTTPTTTTETPTTTTPEPTTTTTTTTTMSIPTIPMSSDSPTPSAGERLDDIVEKGKNLLGVRPPAEPGESRPPYHKTPRGKAVIGAGIAVAAGGLVFSQCGGDGQKTEIPAPVESNCDLTQSGAEEIARNALATSKGDAIKAVAIAEQVIEGFRAPNGKCSNSVVEVAQLSASGYIAENTGSPSASNDPSAPSSTTEPQTGNVPPSSTPGTADETPATEKPTEEPDLTIACSNGQIDYEGQNVANSITNMPPNLWESKPCSVEAGTSQDKGIGNGEVVRIEGR